MRGWLLSTRSCRASCRRWNSAAADAPPWPSTRPRLGNGAAANPGESGSAPTADAGDGSTVPWAGAGSFGSSELTRLEHVTQATVLLARS